MDSSGLKWRKDGVSSANINLIATQFSEPLSQDLRKEKRSDYTHKQPPAAPHPAQS